MPLGPEDFTVSGLPRSSLPGGLKTDAVADLLHRAAFDYRAVLAEARQLVETTREQSRRIEELEARIASFETDVATREDHGTEAIGKALLAAARAGEDLTTEARLSATRITAEAEARAAAILERATTAAEKRERESIAAREKLEIQLAAAHASVEKERAAARVQLEHERAQVLDKAHERAETILTNARREVEQLRSLLSDAQSRLVELADSSRSQLEDFGAKGGSNNADLLDDLRPPDGEPPRSGVARDPSSTKPPTTTPNGTHRLPSPLTRKTDPRPSA